MQVREKDATTDSTEPDSWTWSKLRTEMQAWASEVTTEANYFVSCRASMNSSSVPRRSFPSLRLRATTALLRPSEERHRIERGVGGKAVKSLGE